MPNTSRAGSASWPTSVACRERVVYEIDRVKLLAVNVRAESKDAAVRVPEVCGYLRRAEPLLRK